MDRASARGIAGGSLEFVHALPAVGVVMEAAVACSISPPLPLPMLLNDSSTHSFFLGRNSLGLEQSLECMTAGGVGHHEGSEEEVNVLCKRNTCG